MTTASTQWWDTIATIDATNRIHKSFLKSPYDQQEGTYTLEIIFSATVIAGTPQITLSKTLQFRVRTCTDDGTKFKYGSFGGKWFSEYGDSPISTSNAAIHP